MRSGIEWHEQDRPLDETNTTVQLEWSQDWIQFTLNQPMDADPGTKWVYNSGGSQLMSGIIRAATGRFIDEYANEFLFRPIGINEFHWKKTPTGHPDTEGGLYLAAADLARIGYLYLHDGVWNGRRILPAGWVKNATTRHAHGDRAGTWDYGFQWWLTQPQRRRRLGRPRLRRPVADRHPVTRRRGGRERVECVRQQGRQHLHAAR